MLNLNYSHCTRLIKLEREFYSIKEVAFIFSVSASTIRRGVRKGYISAIRVGDGKKSPYRISRKSLDCIHERLLHFNIIKKI